MDSANSQQEWLEAVGRGLHSSKDTMKPIMMMMMIVIRLEIVLSGNFSPWLERV